jgi:hypothetical protein
MNTKIFDGKEIWSITISALMLGFVFSFRQWGSGPAFELGTGLVNLIRLSILSAIALLVYLISHKLIARNYGCGSTFRIWSIKRFWFTKRAKIKNTKIFGIKINSIKIGIILPLLFSFFSNGLLKFCAVGSSEISEIKLARTKRQFKQVTDFEIAIIHFAGPLTLTLLALILNIIPGFSDLVKISYYIAIFAMVPLAGLDGTKIFFGSAPLYLFGITFIIFSIALLILTNSLSALVFGLIAAVISLLFFIYKFR